MADFRELGSLRRDRFRLVTRFIRNVFRAEWLSDRIDELSAGIVLLRAGGGVVWCNSLASASFVRPALLLGRKVVLHSHEVEPVASNLLVRFRLRGLAHRIRFVACSHAAATALEENLDLATDAVKILFSAPDPPPPGIRRVDTARFLVGGCGVPTYGKGVDLFAALSERMDDPRVGWRWVGGRRPGRLVPRSTKVEFVRSVPDARVQIAMFDVLVHTSRAESASLVILEAMSLGIPVVAFATGGIPEVVGDAGLLVPPGNLDEMLIAVSSLLHDSALRRNLADRGRSRAASLVDPARWRMGVLEVLT